MWLMTTPLEGWDFISRFSCTSSLLARLFCWEEAVKLMVTSNIANRKGKHLSLFKAFRTNATLISVGIVCCKLSEHQSFILRCLSLINLFFFPKWIDSLVRSSLVLQCGLGWIPGLTPYGGWASWFFNLPQWLLPRYSCFTLPKKEKKKLSFLVILLNCS